MKHTRLISKEKYRIILKSNEKNMLFKDETSLKVELSWRGFSSD
jgi:hypothetical protein